MQQEVNDALDLRIEGSLNDLVHTAAAGNVNTVKDNATAAVTPDLKVKTEDGREIPYPKLSGKPIVMPCGSGGKIGFAFPVVAGDGCVIVFGEGGRGTDLKFDLSNAMIVPGLNAEASDPVKKAGSDNAAIMFAGDTTIVVTEDKIEITRGNTKITATDNELKAVCGSANITASSNAVDITASNVTVNGTATVNGAATVNGNTTINGNADITGILTAGGITMNTHTHTGVHGETGGPH